AQPLIDEHFVRRNATFVHPHDPVRRRVLVDEQDVAVSLNDLEWIWHVSLAWEPPPEALSLRILARPARLVRRALLERSGQVRNGFPIHDALTRRHGK